MHAEAQGIVLVSLAQMYDAGYKNIVNLDVRLCHGMRMDNGLTAAVLRQSDRADVGEERFSARDAVVGDGRPEPRVRRRRV